MLASRRRVHRRDLQPAERLAEHRARQRRPQPSPAAAARDARRRPELPLHASTRRRAGSPLLTEPLATFETPHHTPFDYHLHVDDVGHTLVLGATGSGKSFLLNFLVTHAQQYDPLTVVFDLGHSYRKLAGAAATAATWNWVCASTTVTINPFSLEPTPEHLHFLHAFVRVLLEGEDGYRLSDAEDRELYEAVENLYVLDRAQRRLFTLANLLPRGLDGAPAEVGRWRPLRATVRQRRGHADVRAAAGVRLRGDAGVSDAPRAAAVLRAAPRQRARARPRRCADA